MRVSVCVCVNACTWRLPCTFFSSCRGTGADLPILSNEAMASQWTHSLISCVYLRSGRPNCTLKAVVSNSGQKSFKRFHMVDTFRLCRVWSCLSSFASVRAEPKCVGRAQCGGGGTAISLFATHSCQHRGSQSSKCKLAAGLPADETAKNCVLLGHPGAPRAQHRAESGKTQGPKRVRVL